MVEPMELWSLRLPVAVPLPSASVAVRFETKKNAEDEATACAIARIASVATKSLEQRRGAQTLIQTLFQQAQVPGILPTAVLDCDVLRGVGDAVLNERHWWADPSDNAAWKTKKRQIAMRVVRGALQDVAVEILNWMAPLAKKIAETMKPQDLKLSLLVDQWPKGFADVTRAAACGEEAAETSPSTNDRELRDNAFDSYIVLAWAMLRGIYKRDEMPWPTGWQSTTSRFHWAHWRYGFESRATECTAQHGRRLQIRRQSTYKYRYRSHDLHRVPESCEFPIQILVCNPQVYSYRL